MKKDRKITENQKDRRRKATVPAGSSLRKSDPAGRDRKITGLERKNEEPAATNSDLTSGQSIYQILFERSRDAMLLIDENNIFIDCNAATVHMLGYQNKEELLATHPSRLSPPMQPDGRQSFEKAEEMMAIARKEGSNRFEWVHRRADGQDFWVEVSLTLIPFEGKQMIHTAWRDITGRKRAEKELWESREYYRAIIDYSQVAIAVLDVNYRVIAVNAMFSRLFNKPLSEFTGKYCYNEFEKRDAVCLHCPGTRAMVSRKAEEVETEGVRDDGTRFSAHNRAVPFFGPDGSLTGFVEMVEDVTERKKAEATLKRYSEKLEEMVDERTKELREAQDKLIKSEKLAVLGKLAGGVGHELRNPLGAIKNAAYFLNMALENPDPDVKDTLEVINKEVKRSEDIVSDLLDFARPTVLTLRKTAINRVLSESVGRSKIPEKVTVTCNLDETIPEIMADPDKLLQVFTNLITNGWQAMPDGGKMTVTSTLSEDGQVIVSVSDTGTGITEANMKKIFEPLFTTKPKGIGLGLVVIKAIIEAHHGSIGVRSEEGKGTTFTVKLPVGIEEGG